MKPRTILAVLVSLVLLSTTVWGLDKEDLGEISFRVLHANDREVQKAFDLLSSRGILDSSGVQRADDSGLPQADCLVLADQNLLKSSLLRDLLNKKLPPQVLAIDLAMKDQAICVSGRLDGPAFINPKFETRIGLSYVKPNCFRFRIFGMKVMGFNASIFSGLVRSYLDQSFKRMFPAACTTTCSAGSEGSILVDAQISPEGFVPGLGKRAFLSNAGILGGRLFLGFSTPPAR